MKIAVIGAGAMGSFFAAKLAPLADVWLVSRWQEQVSTINQHGLQLIDSDGKKKTISLQATTQPTTLAAQCDIVLIAVKTPDTARASKIAQLLLKPQGITISLQNGLGNLAKMGHDLPADQITQGVTSNGVTLLGPGLIQQAGVGPTYLASKAKIAPSLTSLTTLLNQAGLETYLTDNLESLVWGKLIINVGLNAITAILRVPTGAIRNTLSAKQLIKAAVTEAVAVAVAKQITLPYDDPHNQVQQVLQATATNRTSMLADIMRSVPTEIEAINGAIVAEGQQLGVATPVNQTLVWLVKALEETAAERL